MYFYIQTFGCKVNFYESDWMKEILEKSEFIYENDVKKCDLIIVNSCTVTSQGDSRSLAALKKFRKSNPGAILALMGCFPQTHMERLVNVDSDIIIGTKNRKKLPQLIFDFINNHEKIIAVEKIEKNDDFEEMSCNNFTGHTRAFIKIQDGCNQFCSYCTIPYARGRCRSKSLDVLKKELMEIASKGYKEVVFAGINLAFYGMEWNKNLLDAVKIAANIDGIERIRLGSLEPERITDDDIKYFASCDKFCPQFHLSLQSGSDNTLKRMNRKYNTKDYYELVQKIRSHFPNAAITTDIMVGFPGETEEEFNESVEFVKKINFAKVHVFRYSVREGTKAAIMDNQISEGVKKKRSEVMTDAVHYTQKRFLDQMIGKKVKVLFERDNEPDFHHGHSMNGTVIKISSKNLKKDLHNKIFCVTIVSNDGNFCYGEIAE